MKQISIISILLLITSFSTAQIDSVISKCFIIEYNEISNKSETKFINLGGDFFKSREGAFRFTALHIKKHYTPDWTYLINQNGLYSRDNTFYNFNGDTILYNNDPFFRIVLGDIKNGYGLISLIDRNPSWPPFGTAFVKVDEVYGYFNIEGELVIPPILRNEITKEFVAVSRFNEISRDFSTNGLALSKGNKGFYYINAKGEKVLPKGDTFFSCATPFDEFGYANISKSNNSNCRNYPKELINSKGSFLKDLLSYDFIGGKGWRAYGLDENGFLDISRNDSLIVLNSNLKVVDEPYNYILQRSSDTILCYIKLDRMIFKNITKNKVEERKFTSPLNVLDRKNNIFYIKNDTISSLINKQGDIIYSCNSCDLQLIKPIGWTEYIDNFILILHGNSKSIIHINGQIIINKKANIKVFSPMSKSQLEFKRTLPDDFSFKFNLDELRKVWKTNFD